MNKDEIKNLIHELLSKTNLDIKEIEVSEDNTGNTWFSVSIGEPHLFTEREGEALSALNHLIRRIIDTKTPPQELPPNTKRSILIDINNFQKKRIESVQAVAHMMGERARYFKSNIEVDPMSPFERRIVHEFLAGAEDLKTESIGMGPTRRVVIKYIGSI